MSIIVFIPGIISLILLSAFFSGSEIGFMSLNKYRLRYLAKKKYRSAIRTQKLLKRPDRLLGTILIGNTFGNIFAGSFTTVYAQSNFDKTGVFIATVILTIAIVLFSEVLPKTIAAVYSEKFAFFASFPIQLIYWLIYPLVWGSNLIGNNILRIFGVNVTENKHPDPLSKEEIHSVVYESGGKLTNKHKNMLLGVLELDAVTIADVMIHRHQIEAYDIADPDNFINAITNAQHSIVLVYEEELDNIIGLIEVKSLVRFICKNATPTNDDIRNLIIEPYYVPDSASLQTQLLNFQKKGCRYAVVVNEYGSIDGIVTVEDILEEIVGEFSDTYEANKFIKHAQEGGIIASGSTTIRELNRHANLNLTSTGAKTLSGMIIDHLETIPYGPCCYLQDGYVIEVRQIHNNIIKQTRIYPHHNPGT